MTSGNQTVCKLSSACFWAFPEHFSATSSSRKSLRSCQQRALLATARSATSTAAAIEDRQMQSQVATQLPGRLIHADSAQPAVRSNKIAKLCRQPNELPASSCCHSQRCSTAQPSYLCRAVLEEGSTRAEDAPPPKAHSSRVTQGRPCTLCWQPCLHHLSTIYFHCTDSWMWNDFKIRYQQCGAKGPAVVLIHGFGGNACAPHPSCRGTEPTVHAY